MFTGLIQEVGTLIGLTRRGSEAEVKVSTSFDRLQIGESIAVSGACLSVIDFSTNWFSAFASQETLAKTGMTRMQSGTRVNLERAARIGDPIGGHLVTGHVDARVSVQGISRIGQAHRFTIALPEPPLRHQIASKGSVAIDGVSLTVNDVRSTGFDVMVIPITLADTTLGNLKPGDTVNIETDVLAKYVARQLEAGGGNRGGIDEDLLLRSGFMR